MTPKQILLSITMFSILSVSQASFAQTETDHSVQSTGETIQIGIGLVKTSIVSNDYGQAAKYSKFTTGVYGHQISQIREANVEQADDLHLVLLDIHSKIESKAQSSEILADIAAAEQLVSEFPKSQQIPFVVSDLLTVADESYQIAISENDIEHHLISVSLVDKAIQLFMSDSSFDERQTGELASFFDDLKTKIAQKQDFVSVGKLITTIQRDLTGTDSASSDHAHLYAMIRQHYDQTLAEIKDGNYAKAEEHVIAAYLDNFEYLEAAIGKADEALLHKMELNMRENLRAMVQEKRSYDEIQSFIKDPILADLDNTENLISESSLAHQPASGIEPEKVTKEMGSATEDQKSVVRSQIDFIRMTLQTMLNHYKEGNTQAAFVSARTAYLDSYEHVEIPLRTIDPDFTLQVELQFAELRSLINQKADYDKIEQATISVRRSLDESERLVTGTGQLAPTIAFTSSFAVIFREGLESVLILGAILTYLEASRNVKFKRFVYYGIVLAIGATVVTWFIASYIIRISGANRELIEAVAALSATAVLFYVSFWILNKIEHKKWMEFVKAKVWQASTTGGTAVFVMLSFFTVYREGFETVLFYEAMFGFAKYMETYVGLGFVAGIATLLGVYFVTRKLGKRLPLKMLFGLTMGVGAYLSIAFLGNAVRELQTLDILPFTSLLGIIPRLDINMAKMTGIYPTLETIIAQTIMLGIYLVAASYVLVLKPKREEKIATMRKSRREIDESTTH
ncbi:FTR1 family iron permease [Candidatus Nitrosotenuis sp. DW1]|uniref:FTR1 family iron permease n=1 Tax=Candidatus Nitrosotenuis sp. DW1 TaxID=2259672 RepID=UPI002107B3A7|nr:FTR1 family protein [Candidatus Nitrosotenuis sp. DW1]